MTDKTRPVTLRDVYEGMKTDGERSFIPLALAARIVMQVEAVSADEKPAVIDGRKAVLNMRDEFAQLASCLLKRTEYRQALRAATLAQALHEFEGDTDITGIAWPARVEDKGDDCAEFVAADEEEPDVVHE